MMDEKEKLTHEIQDQGSPETQRPRSKVVPGVIYLSRIPPFMTVKKLRDLFEEYGEVGRIFLQPDDRAANTKKGRLFTEGWVEFMDKSVAKRVAANLNCTNIGGKKSSQWYDELWNIKYLHRFKWANLNERLAYEKEVRKHRMRQEISQVKREAQFHIQNAERRRVKEHIDNRKRKQGKVAEIAEADSGDKQYDIFQRETEDEILAKKQKLSNFKAKESTSKKKLKKKEKIDRKAFLSNIFSSGID